MVAQFFCIKLSQIFRPSTPLGNLHGRLELFVTGFAARTNQNSQVGLAERLAFRIFGDDEYFNEGPKPHEERWKDQLTKQDGEE